MESHCFDCACSDFNHIFRFVYDPEDGDLYLDVRLNIWEPWYRRVWYALVYVFCKNRAYRGMYDVTMVRPEDIPRLRELLDRASQGPQEKPVLEG